MSSHTQPMPAEHAGPVRWDHPASAKVEVLNPETAHLRFTHRLTGEPLMKLAIVGYAETTRNLAPFDDDAWVIAGINQLYRMIPRADVWFEIHRNFLDAVVEGTDHAGWLAAAQCPVIMADRPPSVPTSVRYPLAAYEAAFGRYGTSSIAWMLGWGILQGFEEIGIWGVDLAVGTEYTDQRPCAEYLIGYASAKGITIRIPHKSALCKASHLYGFEQEPNVGGVFSREALVGRLTRLKSSHDDALQHKCRLEGAGVEAAYWAEQLPKLGVEAVPEALAKRPQDFAAQTRTTLSEIYQLVGHIKEAQRMIEFLELRGRDSAVEL